MWLYLYLNLFTISFPLILSFDHRVKFVKQWRHFFPAMAIVATFFILWDVWFTHIGVWWFNADYLTGIQFINLPLEEVLFFITVPFACVFIYEVFNHYWPKTWFSVKSSIRFTWALTIFLFILSIIYHQRSYTFITSFLTALLLSGWLWKGNTLLMPHFYRALIIVLIPFSLVNGILTATPVVLYNDNENLMLRLGTIPVEDLIYNLLLFSANILLFEYFRRKPKPH